MSHTTVHPIEPDNNNNGQAAEHHSPEKAEGPHPTAVSTEAEKPWARLLYDPPKSSNARYVMEDFLPPEDIPRSFSTQWYRFHLDGKHYAIRPQHPAHNPHGALWAEVSPPVEFPLDLEDVAIIGYLHPDGIPSLPSDRLELRERAVSAVSRAGYDPIDIVAIHRDSRWLEPMLLIPGIPRDKAGSLAAALHQPLFTALERGFHRTYQPDGQVRSGAYQWELLELPFAPCPMSLGYEVTHSPEREGGPWVSRSMLVAAHWQLHFSYTHSLLACDPCQTRQAERGRAITLGDWIPASRYKYIHAADHHLGDEHVLRRFEVGTLTGS